MNQLNIKEAVAAIPMTEEKRAKTFYQKTMGFELELLSKTQQMYWVKISESKFLLYLREQENKAEHTALSFTVENIEKAMAELENKGIKFYEQEGKKVFELDGSLSAWFQDTEGNNLEISQRS